MPSMDRLKRGSGEDAWFSTKTSSVRALEPVDARHWGVRATGLRGAGPRSGGSVAQPDMIAKEKTMATRDDFGRLRDVTHER